MKVAVAVALLFAVNMEADAQFGKLKNLAKKAKEAVIDNSGSGNSVTDVIETTTDDENAGPGVTSDDMARKPGETDEQYNRRIRRIWNKDNPAKLEEFDVEEAGGLQQYLGLTEGDGLIFWKYYEDGGFKLGSPGFEVRRLMDLLRLTKNPYYDTTEGQKHLWTRKPNEVEMWLGYIDEQGNLKGRALNGLNNQQKTMTAPISKTDLNALVRFITKSLKEFEAKYGKIHQ